MSDRYKDSILSIFLLIVTAMRLLIGWSIPLFDQFLLLFGIVYHGFIIGKRLLPRTHWVTGTGIGITFFLGIQTLIQTGWFYLDGRLGARTDGWSSFITMAICLGIIVWSSIKEPSKIAEAYHTETPKEFIEAHASQVSTIWERFTEIGLLACGIASTGYALSGAMRGATLDSIRTTWPFLPPGTLAAIVCAWAACALSIWITRSKAVPVLLSGIALSATSFIAPIIYRIGFGFDGFLHIAAEKVILNSGTLSPKPFYYIGQYVFTTWISRIFDAPISSIDRWLVPVAIVIIMPLAVSALIRTQKDRWLPLLLCLIPLSPFIATTPQSFAYIFGLAALFLIIRREQTLIHPLVPVILAAWSIAIHPLAGIPFFCVALALLVGAKAQSSRWRFVLGICFAFCSALSVPVAFFILSILGKTPITWHVETLLQTETWSTLWNGFIPWIGNRFVVWPAWASLVDQALPAFLVISTIAAYCISEKHHRRTTSLLFISAIALLISSVVLKHIGDFSFLIAYERSSYADRLWFIGLLCLVPAAFPFLQYLCQKFARVTPVLSLAGFVCLFSIAAATSMNALPRNDALVVGHGWSVGQADVQAVKLIDRDAGTAPYTVLANQSVSAAAISQLGFKRYQGDNFFYPIPTGGPLYEIFLRATYGDPSVDTIREAATLGGSRIVYVVLNDYWWNAENASQLFSAIATKEWQTGTADGVLGHMNYVYKFDFNTPIKAATQTSGS